MSDERKPLARSLGEFFGILIKAAKEDVTAPKPVVVREDVEETTVETPNGPVTLRRRVIDEVEGPGVRPPDERGLNQAADQ